VQLNKPAVASIQVAQAIPFIILGLLGNRL